MKSSVQERESRSTKDTKVITTQDSPCSRSNDNAHVWELPHPDDKWLGGYQVCSKCGRITKQRVLCD